MTDPNHDYLRRLDPSFYQGLATVHWTHTIEQRKTGWLDNAFHHRFREVLLHLGSTYGIWTISYALMPDHLHLLWFGTRENTDQQLAAAWLRRQINYALKDSPPPSVRLQKQAYDHVLRPDEKDRFSLEKLAQYIWDNPSRAELVLSPKTGPFCGSVVPGSPFLSWSGETPPNDFWEKYWAHRSQKVLKPDEELKNAVDPE